MNPLRSGILYLFIVISIILGNVLFVLVRIFLPYANIPTEAALAMGEILILIPTLLLTVFWGVDVRKTFRIKKVKLRTILLVIPLTYMLMPLVALCNAFTLLFTENVVEGITDAVLSLPIAVTFFILAVFGPFTEELAFRGAEYSGLAESGNRTGAILLQGAMFGLMHMNLNQFVYAFVIGIAFGVLCEVTGSILPGFFAHLLINGSSTVSMYFLEDAGKVSEEMSKADILLAIQGYALLSVFTTAVAFFILILIAGLEEGGRDRLALILRPLKRHKVTIEGNYIEVSKTRVFSIPAVIGLLMAVAVVVFTLIPFRRF